jgi:hypothetical protein
MALIVVVATMSTISSVSGQIAPGSPSTLNEDLNGVLGGINSSTTWEQLGALTQTYLPNGTAPIPEPGTVALLGLGAGFFMLRNAARKNRA